MSVAAAQWAAIGTTARVVVTEPSALDVARSMVIDELAILDLACSRFRSDSEIAALSAADGQWLPVSDVLADVLACALQVAESTDGDVDPTMGMSNSPRAPAWCAFQPEW
jgi:thiamine biosynthesis lipoprotein